MDYDRYDIMNDCSMYDAMMDNMLFNGGMIEDEDTEEEQEDEE